MVAKNKWIIAFLVLAFAFVLTTCEELGYKAETSVSVVNAAPPVITKQPAGGTINLGDPGAKLTVEAEVEDEGDLSYQWFISDDVRYAEDEGYPISGAEESTYIVNLEEGSWQIYVLVTNTNPVVNGEQEASVKSALVRITVNDPGNAPYPNITKEPASTAYDFVMAPAGGEGEEGDGEQPSTPVDALSVEVEEPENGVLSYQWYSSTSFSNDFTDLITTTPIPGATSATYQPQPVTEEGTWYYFVVVTNFWEEAPKRKESVVPSSPAVIKVVVTNAVITVNSTRAQYVRGFGVMAPFWGNSPQDSPYNYEQMYNPTTGLGFNILRIMIPVSSTGTKIKTTMNKALNNELSGDKDRSHYYEIVKIVNKYDGYVLASPWSPPPAWKTNDSVNGGGSLIKANYMDYADYLKEYCQIMLNNGAPIYAVSIQNEPNFKASYDGCEWTDNEMRDFFKQVGSFTEGVSGWGGGAKIPRVLIMNGESANSPTINDAVLNDTEARKIVDLYGRHLYGSQQVTRSSQVQALGKEIWMTEHNINGGNEATYPSDSTYNYIWKFLNDVDVSIRLNKENGFVWWYGKRFYSQIGEGDYGTVDNAVLPRGYALSHYAKYAAETWQVGLTVSGVNATGGAITTGSNFNNTTFNIDSTAVKAAAFQSKDGNSISLVLFTPTNQEGGGGTNLGNVKIVFPDGFTATKVTAMRSRSGNGTENMGKPDNETVLLKGGTSAFLNLPAGQILSVRFTK